MYNDYLVHPGDPFYKEICIPDFTNGDSLGNREIEKTFFGSSQELFESKAESSLLAAKLLGNIYCGSLYAGLASLISSVSPETLVFIQVLLCLPV